MRQHSLRNGGKAAPRSDQVAVPAKHAAMVRLQLVPIELRPLEGAWVLRSTQLVAASSVEIEGAPHVVMWRSVKEGPNSPRELSTGITRKESQRHATGQSVGAVRSCLYRVETRRSIRDEPSPKSELESGLYSRDRNQECETSLETRNHCAYAHPKTSFRSESILGPRPERLHSA